MKIITCKTLKTYSEMFDELQIKSQQTQDNCSITHPATFKL